MLILLRLFCSISQPALQLLKGHTPLLDGKHYLLGQKAYMIMYSPSRYAFASGSSAVWVQRGAAWWEDMAGEVSSAAL